MNAKKITSMIAASLLSFAGAHADTIAVPETQQDFFLISEDTTWTSDNTYLLNGFVVVPDGVTLTIEPGTVILGDTINGQSRTAESGVALIVAQGGTLIANGTASNPIIFTAEGGTGDPAVDDSTIQNPELVRGLWGGVILLGKATINSNGQNGDNGGPATTGLIEGVSAVVPSVHRTYGGGTDDADSSGSLRYVSIRHTGADLNDNDEIQGLTCGGVGSGTVIEYLEVFASNDDGVEMFGGTVNVKNLVVFSKRDDGLDFDQGYNGSMQFVLVVDVLGPDGIVGRGSEADGGDGAETALPLSTPMVANATMIGVGADIDPADLIEDENLGARIRDNSALIFVNSFFTEYNAGAFRYDSDNAFTSDSKRRLLAGGSEPVGNYVEADRMGAVVRKEASESDSLVLANGDADVEFIFTDASLNNVVGDIGLKSISRTTDGGLNPVIDASTGSIALPTPESFTGDFFTNVDFIGAFDPSATGLWTDGWTALSQLGYTPAAASAETYLDDGRTSLGNSFYITAVGGMFITPATHPWYYHAQFGWLYTGIDGNSNSAGWYYAFNPAVADFVFMGEGTWPFAYFNSESAWLFADEANLISGANGAFFFRTDGTFINVNQ